MCCNDVAAAAVVAVVVVIAVAAAVAAVVAVVDAIAVALITLIFVDTCCSHGGTYVVPGSAQVAISSIVLTIVQLFHDVGWQL